MSSGEEFPLYSYLRIYSLAISISSFNHKINSGVIYWIIISD